MIVEEINEFDNQFTKFKECIRQEPALTHKYLQKMENPISKDIKEGYENDRF